MGTLLETSVVQITFFPIVFTKTSGLTQHKHRYWKNVGVNSLEFLHSQMQNEEYSVYFSLGKIAHPTEWVCSLLQ